MKKLFNNKFIALLLGVLSILITYYTQKIDPIVCIALTTSLFIAETEKITFKNSIFTVGIFTSFCLFPHNELIAFCIFEVSRLINKGMKNISTDLFSLVPIAALLFSFFQTREFMVLLYFATSFTLIFFDRISEKKDWPSLTLIVCFISLSNIITSSWLIWIIAVYFLYIGLSRINSGTNKFFNYICISLIGLMALSFPINKIFTYIVISTMYTYISKEHLQRVGIMNMIYMFTVLMFAKPYLAELTKVENLFAALIFLLPLVSLKHLKKSSQELDLGFSSKFRLALSLLVYVSGVYAYAF